MNKLSDFMIGKSFNEEIKDNFTFISSLEEKLVLPNEGLSVIISNSHLGIHLLFTVIFEILTKPNQNTLFLSTSWFSCYRNIAEWLIKNLNLSNKETNDLFNRLFIKKLNSTNKLSIGNSLEKVIEEEKIKWIFLSDFLYGIKGRNNKLNYIESLRELSEKHHLTVFALIDYPLSKIKKKHYINDPEIMNLKRYKWLLPYFDQVFSLNDPGLFNEEIEDEKVYLSPVRNIFSLHRMDYMELSRTISNGKIEILGSTNTKHWIEL